MISIVGFVSFDLVLKDAKIDLFIVRRIINIFGMLKIAAYLIKGRDEGDKRLVNI